MKFRITAVVLTGFALVAAAPAQDAKKDQQAMQGTWQLTKVMVAGKAQQEDLSKKITIVIDGDKITVKMNADVINESTFKLDATKKPKQMDAVRISGPEKGQTSMTIYALDGDTLKVCGYLGEDASKKRPASFDQDKDMNTNTMYMQRQKK